jgi:succinate dehydrogenase / fumarate reductase cytochrome b subunit
MRPNNRRYGYYGNLKFILQRLSALGLVAFVAAHVYTALYKPRVLEGHPETLENLASFMRFHLPTLIVYLLGTLAVSFHLANGLQTFAMGWGLVTGRRALVRLDRLVIALFIVLLTMSWASIYGLWRAGGH